MAFTFTCFLLYSGFCHLWAQLVTSHFITESQALEQKVFVGRKKNLMDLISVVYGQILRAIFMDCERSPMLKMRLVTQCVQETDPLSGLLEQWELLLQRYLIKWHFPLILDKNVMETKYCKLTSCSVAIENLPHEDLFLCLGASNSSHLLSVYFELVTNHCLWRLPSFHPPCNAASVTVILFAHQTLSPYLFIKSVASH
jgi:hypothetical protein